MYEIIAFSLVIGAPIAMAATALAVTRRTKKTTTSTSRKSAAN